jgi:hypothetical protein
MKNDFVFFAFSSTASTWSSCQENNKANDASIFVCDRTEKIKENIDGNMG